MSLLLLFMILIPSLASNLENLKIIDSLLRKYDRRATPTTNTGEPTMVKCEVFVRSFGSISEKAMDYQVDLYLRQHWHDPRLNHSEITQVLDLNDPKLVQAIWKPEVYFPNAKEAEFQYVTVPNLLLSIKPLGQILYMLRLKLTFSCMMDLNKYPLDDQVCTMEIASFSKTMKELQLAWKSDVAPVTLSPEVKMPQFIVQNVLAELCDEAAVLGNYSCLAAKFQLHRSIGFHLVQSYIPTILFVIVSWVSFWMDVEHVPGRVALGVTTLLTISSKSAGLSSESPQVSYVKAIDIWMGACTAFVFAALIEFTVVNYLYRRGSRTAHGEPVKRKLPSLRPETETCLLPLEDQNASKMSEVTNGRGSAHTEGKERWEVSAAVGIDVSCRLAFPVAFIIFNCIYWWYYMIHT